ncbi:MAG: hypothetical protein LBB24_01135 [Rickettsiales bacterium]|nr:hypothetical protein [Rickettsiales bacterium]
MIKEFMEGMVSLLPFVHRGIHRGSRHSYRDVLMSDWRAVGGILESIGKAKQNDRYKNDKHKPSE